MKLMHLSLLLVTLNFEMCSGILLDISGSSKFAVLSKPFTLTCTATRADHIAGKISFYRRVGNVNAKPFGTLFQRTHSCEVSRTPRAGLGRVSCGFGTTRRTSTTKTYLAQFNVTESDLTVWFCSFGINILYSNKYTVQVKGKVHVNSAAEPPITDPFTLPIVFTVAQLVIGALSTFL